MAQSTALQTRVGRVSRSVSISFAVLLAVLVPFRDNRNIDLQGLVLLLAGAAVWFTILLKHQSIRLGDRLADAILLLFCVACLINLIATPHFGYNALGSPYIRLGALGILSCVGVGLLLRDVDNRQLQKYLYAIGAVTALLSLCYTLVRFHSFWRFGGVFSQADIMAVSLGVSILLGWRYCLHGKYRYWCMAVQIGLGVLLILTQTRAVIGLVLLLSLIYLYRKLRRQYWLIPIILLCVVTTWGLQELAPHNRLTDARYASESVTYRLHLNEQALRAALHRPLAGYGIGNLADALDCRTIKSHDLAKSCQQGYFFNSSHDIFIDRILALGWIGGISYVLFVALSLFHGRKQTSNDFQYVRVLIVLYYLTNVTSVVLELFFWVVLIQAFVQDRGNEPKHTT